MSRTLTDRAALCLVRLVAFTAFSACAGDALSKRGPDDPPDTEGGEAATGTSASLFSTGNPADRRAFERAFPHTNGRACATCHVLEEDTTLRPASVEARLRANPRDPLFNRLDADDPTAAVPTYEALKKGLVRVILPLPANMDVIDLEGRVITPADRRIFVWRGVPTVANTALTAPYQFDGRAPTLQEQAQAAILSHSEGRLVARRELDRIAAFQKATFTSPRAGQVAALLAAGFPVERIPAPEQFMALSPDEQRGRTVYLSACEPCHGGATTNRIINREVHDFFFPALKPDGNVRFQMVPGVGPVPVRISRPNVEIQNNGYTLSTYFPQIGLGTAFNASVRFPQYRFRFYEDGTRRRAVVDLPPVPVTASGDLHDPRPKLDPDGAPIVGPNLVPQLFTVDPGRAAITGDPADFEAFDVPQLRGIAGTAPYFHDNSHETLRDVVDTYSRIVLPAVPPLKLPAVNPAEKPGGRKESLSVQQKEDLLAFLRRL
ncbi:MAG TPA: cytochrome-c peroxidase [Polyangia bacterium]